MTTANLATRYRRTLLNEREMKQAGSRATYVSASVLLAGLLVAVRPDLRTAVATLALGVIYLLLSWAVGIRRELSENERRRQHLVLVQQFLNRPDLDSVELLQSFDLLAAVYRPAELAQAGENLARDFVNLLSALDEREEA
ncbi:hypothetical protein OOK58_27555 [Streptomyces sp. NBC_01728]|uniref:hypothetical protein n=1 Tax=unclassified Streptomyces TaxID=2593676 RepID=UPI002255F18E|nr:MULTISPECIES: hypothetical protein [unclassified Streptomyces]MCX4455736.1 hypothetical protein [Streptomyces sp. NBC_01719]MCX4495096.1 hypothetical protein [Streptomyces sp. NBC_01728]